MKILFAEEALKVIGKGSYTYSYSLDGTMMFLEINTESSCIFDDDIQKIRSIFSRVKDRKIELQYISMYKNDKNIPKLRLNYVVDLEEL